MAAEGQERQSRRHHSIVRRGHSRCAGAVAAAQDKARLRSAPGQPTDVPLAQPLGPMRDSRRLGQRRASMRDTVESTDPSPSVPPPEFFENAIVEIRRHWVDPAARREKIEPSAVYRALVIGNTGAGEVRINEAAKAVVYVGDDRIVDVDQAAALLPGGASDEQFRGLLPDVGPDEPYSFFDLRLGYLSFNFQPGRERARRHLTAASQFWHAARDLVRRGGIDAACENMFAAAELATMAMMEGTTSAIRAHSARSAWLQSNGPAYGLTPDESACLGKLLSARNLYRYGDATSTITPVALVEIYSHVEAVLMAAQQAIAVDAT